MLYACKDYYLLDGSLVIILERFTTYYMIDYLIHLI